MHTKAIKELLMIQFDILEYMMMTTGSQVYLTHLHICDFNEICYIVTFVLLSSKPECLPSTCFYAIILMYQLTHMYMCHMHHCKTHLLSSVTPSCLYQMVSLGTVHAFVVDETVL